MITPRNGIVIVQEKSHEATRRAYADELLTVRRKK